MKIFHFIKSKLSAVTSKLADNARTAVINSEIAKGKNPLQTLCDEAERLKQQLAVANESLKQWGWATQARKETHSFSYGIRQNHIV